MDSIYYYYLPRNICSLKLFLAFNDAQLFLFCYSFLMLVQCSTVERDLFELLSDKDNCS